MRTSLYFLLALPLILVFGAGVFLFSYGLLSAGGNYSDIGLGLILGGSIALWQVRKLRQS